MPPRPPASQLRLALQSLTLAAGARQARRPRSRRSRAHAAGGELEPSLCSGTRTGSPGCAQVLLQCALALGLAAFGVVVVAGKLQVSDQPLRPSTAPLTQMRCAPQPISLSAMMDGASASFEDFNPDFMVRCLPHYHGLLMCVWCAACTISPNGACVCLFLQVFHGRKAK